MLTRRLRVSWPSNPHPNAPHAISTGKSSLINALKADGEREAEAGRRTGGVTKAIAEYRGKPINGRDIFLLDTPGVGDADVSTTKLVALVEAELAPGGEHRKLDGVIVTTPAYESRVKLGAQVRANQ